MKNPSLTVRLPQAGFKKLDAWPGRTRSEKLRAALDSQSVALVISRECAAAVGRENANLLTRVTALDAALARQIAEVEQLRRAVENYTAAAAGAVGSAEKNAAAAQQRAEEMKTAIGRAFDLLRNEIRARGGVR